MDENPFRIEEYKSLQAELRAIVDESAKLELYSVGALGAF